MKNLYLTVALLSAAFGNIIAMDQQDLIQIETQDVAFVPTSVIIDPLEQNTHAGYFEQATQQINTAQTITDYEEIRETLLDWLDFIKQNQNTANAHTAFMHVQTFRNTIFPRLRHTRHDENLDIKITAIDALLNTTQADH